MSALNDDVPVSPLKKLKILGEKQNVPEVQSFEARKAVVEAAEAVPEKADSASNEVDEPLLEENPNRYVIFPINQADMWSMYKHLVDNFWSVTETLQQFDSMQLTYNETQFVKYFASIFASPKSKGLVNDNFAEDFCRLIQVTEAKFFYGHQLMVQNIHYEFYNLLLDKFAKSHEDREKMFKIVENFDAVANKRNWVSQWAKSSFGEQLAASACLHGLLFCSIDLFRDWLKNRTKSDNNHELLEVLNRMIIDQELQRDFSCLMIGHLKHKPSQEKMLEMVTNAAKLEFDFLVNALKIDLVEMDLEEVILLIDRKTRALKLKLFNVEQRKQIVNEIKKVSSGTINAETGRENTPKLVLDEDF